MSFIYVSGEIHVVVDIETLSTQKDAAITEIGAVVLHPDPKVGMGIPLTGFHEECFDPYGHVCNDTLSWRRDHNLPWQVYPNVPIVTDTLSHFFSWLETQKSMHKAELVMWCKGTDFDKVILEGAAARSSLELKNRIPWAYNKFFDCRTLLKLFPQFKVPRDSVAHNGFADARQQAMQLIAIDAHLSKLESYWNSAWEHKNHEHS